MSALTTLRGAAAPLFEADIDTDAIAPMARDPATGVAPAGVRSQEELARRLFGRRRWKPDGSPEPGFVLNRPPFDRARFLVAGRNFACGSSRETAATMLSAFGIRCVIAPSFGGIFTDNCFRNHMLPLQLEAPVVEELAGLAADGRDFLLDLHACTLVPDGAAPVSFALPSFRREMLLRGADEIEVTLARASAIAAWQAQARRERPWEWTSDDPDAGRPAAR
jgi:3-isopropylmalate/(R)-2-methylmalate dehydratase small subunit